MRDKLYETDFYSWAHQQSDLLRQGQFDQLDLSHLVEELTDLGNRHTSELSDSAKRCHSILRLAIATMIKPSLSQCSSLIYLYVP